MTLLFIASGVCTGWVPGVEFKNNKAIVTSKIIFGGTGEIKLVTNEYNLGEPECLNYIALLHEWLLKEKEF